MSFRNRHLLATGAALLAFGAGVTPAIAQTTTPSGHTPAAQDIIAVQAKGSYEVPGLGTTPAQDRTRRASLLAQARTDDQAASKVSKAYASPTQREGRAMWVRGEREGAGALREYAYAEKLMLEGNTTEARAKENAADKPLMAGDVLIVHGTRKMGIVRFLQTKSR